MVRLECRQRLQGIEDSEREYIDPVKEMQKDLDKGTPYGFLFPSLASEYLGMGQGVCRKSRLARDLFSRASDVLGRDLLKALNTSS